MGGGVIRGLGGLGFPSSFLILYLILFYLGIEQAIYDYDYEALEDIWLKAGEMEPSDATFTTDEGYGSR